MRWFLVDIFCCHYGNVVLESMAISCTSCICGIILSQGGHGYVRLGAPAAAITPLCVGLKP
jgi:hypothetical protein